MLKIYLILMVNDVCLLKYAKQLQLYHLILEYRKEAAFVPKSGKIVAKINLIVQSRYTYGKI